MMSPISTWLSWGAWSFPGPPLRLWLILAGWALVGFWLTRGLLKSSRSARRGLRLTCSLAALTALALLGLRPHRGSEVNAQSALLLTPGAGGQTLEAFLDGHAARDRLFSLPGVAIAPKWKAETIPDLGYLKRHYPAIRHLRVFGNGLAPFELQALAPIRVEPHLEPETAGFAFLDWEDSLQLGQDLVVRGRLSGDPPEESRLALRDPGGGESLLPLASIPDGLFSFTHTPRTDGRHFYTLELLDAAGESLARERLAVDVRSARAFSVLFLEAAPHFETKHLKRWLEEGGHSYLIRSRISQDIYRWENGNREAMRFKALNSDLLASFDLLITDGRTLVGLSDAERETLRAAIADQGLGLLIRPDGASFSGLNHGQFFWSFRILPIEGAPNRVAGVLLIGLSQGESPALPLTGHELDHGPGQFPLAEDGLGRVLAAWVPRGKGRIATSLIDGAYRWRLQGHPERHAAYWKRLIQELARPQKASDQWRIVSLKPYLTDHPIQLALRTADSSPRVSATAPSERPLTLPPRQDPTRLESWTTLYWPAKPGWHQVQRKGGEAFRFHVSEPERWQGLQAAQKRQATLDYAQRVTAPDGVTTAMIATREEFPRAWLFAIFLLSSAALWLERKWSG